METALCVKRVCVYLAGLLLMALGSNLAALTGLGMSPVNSVPYLVSLVSGLSFGVGIILVFTCYVLLELLLLGRDFRPRDLLQVAFAVIFGRLVSITAPPLSFLKPKGYGFAFLLLLVSIFFVALGVSLYLQARLISLPAEGLTAALAIRLKKWPFYRVKTAVDCAFVALSVFISLAAFGRLTGVREGTLLAAYFVGWLLPYARRLTEKPLRAFLGAFQDGGESPQRESGPQN